MAIDFPNPPLTIGQQYQFNGTTWQWNGAAWVVVGTYPAVGNYVVTYNGLTGAVSGVTVGGTNVFTALNTFSAGISSNGSTFSGLIRANAGISASGGTFANDIAVNSMTIGRGTANVSSNIAFGASAYFSGTTGANNVAIGLNALRLNQAGDINTAIGAGALQSNVNGRNNVAIGWSALNTLNTTTWSAASQAEYNVGIGGNALGAATIGSYNIAIGAAAAQALTTSNSNIAIGTYSLLKCGAGGGDNTTIGHQSMLGSGSATTQTYNTSIGANSMFSIATANYNTAVGHSALFTSTTGQYNTIIGAFALYHATAPNYSVAIGMEAGRYAGSAGATLSSSTNSIYIGSGSKSGFTTSSNEIVIGSNALGLGSNTTVIGLTATTSTTIYGLLNAPSGISASGATFSGSVILQNQEFIRNTTNGRMDFMPAPIGSTQFGMYMDFTSWSYGVKLGTIRSSDNVLNAAGFLWDAPLTISQDVGFNLGSNAQNGIINSSIGNDTIQFYTNTTTGSNSGALALVDSAGLQTANRSPGVTHANPNLYVYRSGSANANDFIRIEHDGTNGLIVSGGTSGIFLQSGSGVVGISGGICASGMVVLAQGVSGGYGNDLQSYGYTSGYDIIPTNWQCISANITTSPNINSVYLAPINISKKSIIKSIATQRGTDATGNTGNFYLGLYNSNLYGLPNTLVYSSPSSTLGTGNFGVVRVSNVNYTANPGAYWIGIVFSAAGLSAGLARYGGVAAKMVTPTSSSPVAQALISGLTASTSGFTLPANLNNLSISNVTGNDFPAVFFTAEGAT